MSEIHYDNTDVMHEVIAQRLKEVKNYTGDFNEYFNYEKDVKLKMEKNILTLRIRYVVLEDKTLLSIKELFGVDGFTCNFKK